MEIIIKNIEDIEYYINNITEDAAKSSILLFSKEFKPSFEFKIIGEGFNSTINTTIMNSLLKLQKSIYMLYSFYTYGEIKTLSQKEKNEIELFVKVESGSSLFKVFFSKLLSSEIFNNMDEKTKRIVIIVLGFIILGVPGLGVYNNLQEKRIISDSHVNIVKAISENNRDMYRELSKINPDVITIQGQDINIADLREITARQKQPELLDNVTLSGKFRVLSIHFDYLVETSFMNAQYIATGEVISDISLQDCFISDEKLKMIQNAEKKEPVDIVIKLTRKGSKIINAHLDISSN